MGRGARCLVLAGALALAVALVPLSPSPDPLALHVASQVPLPTAHTPLADGRAALVSGAPQDPELLEQSGGRMPLTLSAFVHAFASGLPTLLSFVAGISVGALAALGFGLTRRSTADPIRPAKGDTLIAMAAYYSERALAAMDEEVSFIKHRRVKPRRIAVPKSRPAPPPPAASSDVRLDVPLLMACVGEELGTECPCEEGMAELMQAIWANQNSRRWRGRPRDGPSPPPAPVCRDGVLEWCGALALVVNVGGMLQGSDKNLFVDDGRRFVWRPSNRRSLETAPLQRMLRTATFSRFEVTHTNVVRLLSSPTRDAFPPGFAGMMTAIRRDGDLDNLGGGDPLADPGPLPILLFCRTSKRVPYVFCGRLENLTVDTATNPHLPTFLWTLADHPALRHRPPFEHVLHKSTGGAFLYAPA